MLIRSLHLQKKQKQKKNTDIVCPMCTINLLVTILIAQITFENGGVNKHPIELNEKKLWVSWFIRPFALMPFPDKTINNARTFARNPRLFISNHPTSFLMYIYTVRKDTELSIDRFNDLENPPPEVVSAAIHLKGIQTQSD